MTVVKNRINIRFPGRLRISEFIVTKASDARTKLTQQGNHFLILLAQCNDQGRAIVAGDIRISAALQQLSGDIKVPTFHCQGKRRITVVLRDVYFRARIEQRLDNPKPDEPVPKCCRSLMLFNFRKNSVRPEPVEGLWLRSRWFDWITPTGCENLCEATNG